MPIPMQDQPESTIGRKPTTTEPAAPRHPGGGAGSVPVRSGASIRREEADESEAGAEIREREGGEPPVIQGLEE